MNEKLRKHFFSIQPLSDKEIEAIDETMTIQDLKNGTVLLKEGETSNKSYFVLEGMHYSFSFIISFGVVGQNAAGR